MPATPKRRKRAPEVTLCACMDHAFAPLTKGYVTLVDPADSDLLAAHCWHAFIHTGGHRTRVYAVRSVRRNGRKAFLLLHRVITGAVGKAVVDHESHNGLDNRRPNLRPGTGTQNQGNRRKTAGAVTSRFKGVCRFKGVRWRAYISSDGRTRHLGLFDCEIEAARAYDAAARAYFGEYALTNFPQEQAA